MAYEYIGSEYEDEYLHYLEKQKKDQVTEEKTIGQLLYDHPELKDPLKTLGMHCLGCPAAQQETLKEAAEFHKIGWEKLKEFLEGHMDKNS